MARSRSRAERSLTKQIRLEHQRGLSKELGVTHTLEMRDDRIVEIAEREPIVDGFPRDSQTAVVMRLMKTYGVEGARL